MKNNKATQAPRFIVHGGYIPDGNGNQIYVPPYEVMKGYGLKNKDCLLVRDVSDYRIKTKGLPYHSMHNYHPPIDGDYRKKPKI